MNFTIDLNNNMKMLETEISFNWYKKKLGQNTRLKSEGFDIVIN